MKITATQILALAESQVGIKEQPSGSNTVKYNTDYYGRKVKGSWYPWCCTFIWWLFRTLGAAEMFYGGGKTASCSTLYKYHKKRGQVLNTPQPGDLVFFKFNKTSIQHIGICVSATASSITTIDGNTGIGNEANGGAVMMRTRAKSNVYGYIRPAYLAEPVAPAVETMDYSLVFDADYYAMRYADLKAAFGTDKAKLLQHFIQFGMNEGRQAIATFNVMVYKTRYKDLQAAFGNDLEKYYEHYIRFGYKEGRKAV